MVNRNKIYSRDVPSALHYPFDRRMDKSDFFDAMLQKKSIVLMRSYGNKRRPATVTSKNTVHKEKK